MSFDAKRIIGNGLIAVVMVALGYGAWTLLNRSDGDDPQPSGRSPSTSATSSAAPSSDATSTAPPSAAPTYINAAPGETPPVRPPDEMSDAGFEAFVRYFVQASDWALATMDPTLLDQASSPDCGGCNSLIRGIKDDVAKGNRIEGNRYSLLRVSVNPDLSPDGSYRNAGYWWDATEYTLYGPDGAIIERDPPETNAEWSLNAHFSNGRWQAISLLYVDRTR